MGILLNQTGMCQEDSLELEKKQEEEERRGTGGKEEGKGSAELLDRG